MKPFRKLEHQQEEQTEQQTTSTHQQKMREFNNAEEMLRHDAERTEVPAAIEARLRESIAGESRAQKSWWQRIFGR